MVRHRQNNFSFTLIKLVYCLTRKTRKYNSLVQKICLFRQKESSHCKNSLVFGPQGPKQYIFGDHFYSKNAKKLRFHLFLLFHVRNHMASSFYLELTKFTRNCEFCSNCRSPWTRIKLGQIHNFLWIRYTSGKMMISYAFELSGIFWIKLVVVAKNIVLGSPETHFLYMRVKVLYFF